MRQRATIRDVALIWLVIGIALIVVDLFTPAFFLMMFGAGALAAAAAAAADVGLLGQTVIFALVSAAALALVRPTLKRYFDRDGGSADMGLAALEGAEAVVLEEIDSEHGLVKIEGEIWRARPYDTQQVIPAGERVRVVEIKGATAMVWRD